MLFNLILASQLLLMSDRAYFWDAENSSSDTEFSFDMHTEDISAFSQQIKGKNVLLLVHGYNDNAEAALSTYRLVNLHVSAFLDGQSCKFYDYVIGYLWSGCDEAIEYFKAKSHTTALASKMRSHLEFLSNSAAKVDVLAHSMGNLLMFKALDYPHLNIQKKLVQNYYALAAAVDDENLEKHEKYYCATENCEKLFVFYSKADEVLKWGYSLAEFHKALGLVGAEHPNQLPKNVQLIDCTNFIHAHSQYFTVLPIYDFIKNQFLQSLSLLNSVEKTNHLVDKKIPN